MAQRRNGGMVEWFCVTNTQRHRWRGFAICAINMGQYLKSYDEKNEI
jgi:acetolactate synthase regulatory subunit